LWRIYYPKILFLQGQFFIFQAVKSNIPGHHLMRINGLIQTCVNLHHRLFKLATQGMPDQMITFQNSETKEIQTELVKAVDRIEKLCAKHKATSADLPNPSFRAYQWLKFLNRKPRLLDHLRALRDFYALSIQLVRTKNLLPPKLMIHITHSNYLYRVRQTRGMIDFEINEGFINAPMDIKEKLVTSALDRKNRKYAKDIRTFNSSDAYQKISDELNAGSQINRRSFQGSHINLKELFDQINQEYFHSQLEQPRLMWSVRRSKRRLGFFDPHSNTITINRRFDTPDTPRALVEYVMYHEMLHLHLGIREANGRRYSHTSTFKRAEKRFKHYEAAEKLIKLLNN
jgi:predicted metal-dependent hydrolase